MSAEEGDRAELLEELNNTQNMFGAPGDKEIAAYGCVVSALYKGGDLGSYVAKATANDVWQNFSGQLQSEGEDMT